MFVSLCVKLNFTMFGYCSFGFCVQCVSFLILINCFYQVLTRYGNSEVMAMLISFLVVLLAFFLYINSVVFDFVFDDISAIVKNNDVTGSSSLFELLWNDYWGMSMSSESSHKSYRPFTVLTFRFNHFLFGANPWSYHFINVILYCVVCYLVFQFYMKVVHLCFNQYLFNVTKGKTKPLAQKSGSTNESHLNDEQYIAVVATFFFVVHPTHTEAVSGLVGRAELLSTIFFVLSILCYLKSTFKHMFLFALLIVFAVLSKEQGITAIAVCAFVDIIVVNRLTLDEFCLLLISFFYSPKKIKFKLLLLRILICFIIGISLLFLRYKLMNGTLPYFTAFDNPASASKFPSRYLTFNYLLPVNAWLLLNPNQLLCDWTMATIPLIENFYDPRNLATVLFWIFYIALGFSIFFHSQICKMVSLSVAVATFSFLPASNLFFSVGFVVAERVLFLPSIGFCLLSAVGFWILRKKLKLKQLVDAVVLLILVTHSLKTIHRNFDWASEEDLFKSGLKVTEQNAKIWNNIGHVYQSREEWSTALKYFSQAAEVQPDDVGSYINVASTHERLGNLIEAEINYRKAKSLFPKRISGKSYQARIAPSHLQVFIKLSNILKNDGRFEEADDLLREAIGMRRLFVDAYLNRGDILVRLNRSSDALVIFQQALDLPGADKSDVYFNIGVVQSTLGNITGAVEAYTYSISHNPNNIQALINSAAIFEETRQPSLLARAKTRIQRVLTLEPDNLLALSLMGSIHMDAGQNDEAITYWKKALEINGTYRVCLFNLALISCKTVGKDDECLDTIQTLLHHYPDHIKGHLLYGDHMLNKRKNLPEAKKAYIRIKAIEPNHIEANHNFCVVLVEENELKEAESCLKKVYQLAPDVEYIQENLAKVQRQIKLIEIRSRSMQQKEDTNFKKTIPVANNKDTSEEKPKETNKQGDTVYVAKRIQKKKSPFEEADHIRDDLASVDNKDIEKSLKKTAEAVRRLKELKKDVDAKTDRHCRDSASVENLRKSALKVLDDLESRLD